MLRRVSILTSLCMGFAMLLPLGPKAPAQSGTNPLQILAVISATSSPAAIAVLPLAGPIDVVVLKGVCASFNALPAPTLSNISTWQQVREAPGAYCVLTAASGTSAYSTPQNVTVPLVAHVKIVTSTSSSKNTQLVVTVSGNAATPALTGTVSFVVGGWLAFSETLRNGTFTVQMPTALLKNHTWYVIYSGDSHYATNQYILKS